MKKIQLTRKYEAALLLAVTVPFIGLQAWAAGAPLPANADAVKVPAISANQNLTNSNVSTVAPGPSLGGPVLNGPVLGGPGSNELLPLPNVGNPIRDIQENINTGTDALNQAIPEGGGIQLGGSNIPGNKILFDQDGNIINGQNKNDLIFDPFIKNSPEEADPKTGRNALQDSADALDQPDPAAVGKTPEEEAADALSGEPAKGTSGTGSGSGSGAGSTASGGSGSIFQDPTKGGPGGGVQQAVDVEGVKLNGRNINVNEELIGNGADGVARLNAKASFGSFEAGVSPFAAANGGALELPAGEAVNAGVVRSLSAPKGATKLGAASIPVEEGNLVVRSVKTNALNNGNLPELEVEGGARLNLSLGKARVNPAAFAEVNETTIRAPRR